MPDADFKAYTSVFRAADNHRIKRNRQPVSCTACQRRKTKCDRQQPCGACVKRGDDMVCRFGSVWPSTSYPSSSFSAANVGSASHAGKQEVQARLVKLEEMVRGLASVSPLSNRRSEHSVSGIGDGNASASIDSSATNAMAPNTSPASATASAAGGHGKMETDKGMGLDMDDGDETTYHGATSWTAVVDSIRDIQSVLATDAQESWPGQDQPSSFNREPDVPLELAGTTSLDDILNSLPSRSDTDRLIAAYFNAKFLSVPFVHVHHFRRRYERFWEDPSSASYLWISIFFTIVSCGAMVASVKHAGSPLTTVAHHHFYMEKAAECLVTGQYLKGKPNSVEALLMYAHGRNIQKTDSDTTIYSLYGLAVRLAQRRGYHLDAAKVSPGISEFECEMRRRTWFMVQTSDLLFSFQLGMPPMIYQEVCDVGHPRNLTDDDFDEHTPVPPERSHTDYTPILAWCTKSRLCRLFRRVMIHALKVNRPSYKETLGLDSELKDYYANAIPLSLRIRTIRSTSFSDEAYTIMHRLILELMYRKTLIILHREYLSVDKDESKYNFSREVCRDSALKILDLHMEFDQEIRPGGRMYEDRYMVSSLTMHDFLIAAMVICLDLSESTDMSLQDRTHRVKILQRAHAIWSERAINSIDAQHASRVLRAILHKVIVETPSSVATDTTTATTNTDTSELSSMPSMNTPSTILVTEIPDADSLAGLMQELPVNFDEMPPLGSFFSTTEGLDWNSIDSYLRIGNTDEEAWTTLNQNLMM